MKIAKTYAYYSAAILLFTAVVTMGMWFGMRMDEQYHIHNEQQSVFQRYQAVLKLESSGIKKTVNDYSFWDEMVEFIDTKDPTWSKLNLDTIHKTFDTDIVMVYNLKKEPVYVTTSDVSLNDLHLDLSSLSTEKPQFLEFFVIHKDAFIQFFLAPVHMSEDIERSGKPLGYFLIGRKWDQDFLNTISALTLGEAHLVLENDFNETRFPFHLPLNDIRQAPVGQLVFSYSPSVLRFIATLQNNVILLGILVLLLVFFLFYFLTRTLLFRPIRYVSMALKTHQLSYIRALSKNTNELGDIAKMLQEYETQKMIIEHYKEAIDETAIVSKTNQKGIITYVNDQFVEISGYSKEELIGRPHNIVRHPDSPSSLFTEMWQTLKNGKTWKGVIKNRRKDGTAYYVKSAIMPLFNAHNELQEYIAIRYDVSDLFAEMDHLKQETPIKLPRRKALLDALEHAILPHLAILNICDFRDINRLYGQSFGDSVLQHLALKVQTLLPDSIQCFYLQGDEFALLSDQTLSENDFQHVCSVLVSLINDEGLLIEEQSYSLSIRAGLAHGLDYIYNRAEIALQEARDAHKSLVVYNDNEGFAKRLQNDIIWQQKLRDALLHNRFAIFFQEIVPLHQNNASRKKYEVLIRLIDEDGQVISPYHFLDLSKRINVYHQLTRFVIQEGVRAALELNCDVSLNITKDDILNQETTTFLIDILQQYPMLKKRITLELVESEGIENSQEVREFLQTVRRHGCLLAIDDFGSGYSNFEYLLRLHVDFIKIDGSLIKDMDTNQTAYTTVKAITHFAKNLDVSVVAEFVHKKEIYTLVKNLGIDFAQGYYLHEPSPKPKVVS